jgi:hypothetical protein
LEARARHPTQVRTGSLATEGQDYRPVGLFPNPRL